MGLEPRAGCPLRALKEGRTTREVVPHGTSPGRSRVVSRDQKATCSEVACLGRRGKVEAHSCVPWSVFMSDGQLQVPGVFR